MKIKFMSNPKLPDICKNSTKCKNTKRAPA